MATWWGHVSPLIHFSLEMEMSGNPSSPTSSGVCSSILMALAVAKNLNSTCSSTAGISHQQLWERTGGRIDRKKAKLQSLKEVLQDPAGFIGSVKPFHMWGHITLEAHFLTFTSSHNFYEESTWHAFNLLKVVPVEMRGVPYRTLSDGWGD